MNGVPRKVPKAKPEGMQAPRVLAFGTSKEGFLGGGGGAPHKKINKNFELG